MPANHRVDRTAAMHRRFVVDGESLRRFCDGVAWLPAAVGHSKRSAL
jgi:hypothetical protein